MDLDMLQQLWALARQSMPTIPRQVRTG